MRVLVVGAGPAGAAAALRLARGGVTVRLYDRAAWPRAKTCGDGLSPDAVAEAAALGVPLAGGLRLEYGVMSSPAGRAFRGGWKAARPWGTVIERRELDQRLVESASSEGADFAEQSDVRSLQPLDARRPLRGVRARIRMRSGREIEELADAVILADGATGRLAAAAGFPAYRSRLIALRGYVRSARDLEPAFGLHFDRAIVPGYAWIFPVGVRRANVGILLDERLARRSGGDLRALLAAWLASSPIARDALGEAPALENVSGGIIPSGRRGKVRGSVFVAGDAAGLADPFSAEGISQALGSGRAVAQALLDFEGDMKEAGRSYESALAPYARNEREARRLRALFAYVVEPITARAARRPALAQHLSSEGFFQKDDLVAFLAGIVRTW